MSKPPPYPPGPGLTWIRVDDFVDEKVAEAIAWLDRCLAECDGDRTVIERERPRLEAKLAAMVRKHYAEQIGALGDAVVH
jgi:hypothetical protein